MAEDKVDFAKVVEMSREFSRPYRVARGAKFKLSDVDPGDTAHLNREDKPQAQEALADRPQRARRCCRTSSTRRTAGRCCSCSRRWTPRARTA